MARYIDADELVKFYESAIADEWNKKTAPISWADAYDDVIADIEDNIPTADVVEVKHARWIVSEFCGGNRIGFCTECEVENRIANYCPNCGAKMDGGVNDG